MCGGAALWSPRRGHGPVGAGCTRPDLCPLPAQGNDRPARGGLRTAGSGAETTTQQLGVSQCPIVRGSGVEAWCTDPGLKCFDMSSIVNRPISYNIRAISIGYTVQCYLYPFAYKDA